MVNIIENWAEINGEISSIKNDEKNKDFKVVVIKLESARDHQHFPNLLQAKETDEIPVKIKADEFDKSGGKQGDKISGIVRAAPNKLHFFKPGTVTIS